MNFQVFRDELLSPILAVLPAIDRKSSLPILDCVRLHLDGTRIRATGSNLEQEFISELDTERDLPQLSLCVNARRLADILKHLPVRQELECAVDGEHLILRSGTGRYRLNFRSGEEFPVFDAHNRIGRFWVPSQSLQIRLRRIVHAVANKDVRYYLCGALWDLADEQLTVVGADGHRMAIDETSITHDGDPIRRTMIVPKGFVQTLTSILPPTDEAIPVSVYESSIRLDLPGGLTVSTKLIDAEYPDWHRVVPGKYSAWGMCSRELLAISVNRVRLLAEGDFQALQWESGNGQLTLQCGIETGESAVESIPIPVGEGGPVLTGFNARYLAEMLATMDGEQSKFQFSQNEHALLWRDPDDSGYRCIVMPIRL